MGIIFYFICLLFIGDFYSNCITGRQVIDSSEDFEKHGSVAVGNIWNIGNLKASIYREFTRYLHSNLSEVDPNFEVLLNEYNSPALASENEAGDKDAVPMLCSKCHLAIYTILEYVRGYGTENLRNLLLATCKQFVKFSQPVCLGNVDIHLPSIKFILDEKANSTLNEYDICAILFQGYQCPYSKINNYKLDFDVGQTVLKESKRLVRSSGKNLTIVHFTDFHYDPQYTEGSAAVCEEPICCRASSKASLTLMSKGAGKWGDYGICDSPGYLVENICNQVSNHHQNIDLIYFTGDFADHFAWATSEDGVKRSIKFVTDILKKDFPSVIIAPVLGNHDVHPSDYWSPVNVTRKNLTSSWVYEYVADLWNQWLPANAVESLRTKGYYTFIIRDGLRLIALNNNLCYTSNLWLIYELESLRIQLEWLFETLLTAEAVNEKVHILGHVPPNTNSCFKPWNDKYIDIIRRFSHIISGQFNGHTHNDEFAIINEKNSDVALNVAWNGGSGTSFVGLNSNYRIYYVDDESFEILDHETWIFNLTEANSSPENIPRWYKEYSFKDLYNLPDLSPASLYEKFKTRDSKLLGLYWEQYVKHSDVALRAGCNEQCIKFIFDKIVLRS